MFAKIAFKIWKGKLTKSSFEKEGMSFYKQKCYNNPIYRGLISISACSWCNRRIIKFSPYWEYYLGYESCGTVQRQRYFLCEECEAILTTKSFGKVFLRLILKSYQLHSSINNEVLSSISEEVIKIMIEELEVK